MLKKIGLDIHGVIDHDPEFFSWLSSRLRDKGWEVHVITGGKWEHNEHLLAEWRMEYDTFFSITDKHVELGTPLKPDCPDGQVCIADNIWDREKGWYCSKNSISVMVDDTLHYSNYMPDFTKFFHYTENNS